MDRINPAEPRRIFLQRQLALVLRNIETGIQRIAMQHEVITKLGASGRDTSEAVRELANFERLHELNIATHRNVMRELTALAEVPRLTRTARMTA